MMESEKEPNNRKDRGEMDKGVVGQFVKRYRPTNNKELIETLKLVVTTVALLVGGWWTWDVFVQQRNPFPEQLLFAVKVS